jgi:hypothetical protein
MPMHHAGHPADVRMRSAMRIVLPCAGLTASSPRFVERMHAMHRTLRYAMSDIAFRDTMYFMDLDILLEWRLHL